MLSLRHLLKRKDISATIVYTLLRLKHVLWLKSNNNSGHVNNQNPGGMKSVSSATLFALTMDTEAIITEKASIMIKLAEAVSI